MGWRSSGLRSVMVRNPDRNELKVRHYGSSIVLIDAHLGTPRLLAKVLCFARAGPVCLCMRDIALGYHGLCRGMLRFVYTAKVL